MGITIQKRTYLLVRLILIISTGSPGWKCFFESDGISMCRRSFEYFETLKMNEVADDGLGFFFILSTSVDRGSI